MAFVIIVSIVYREFHTNQVKVWFNKWTAKDATGLYILRLGGPHFVDAAFFRDDKWHVYEESCCSLLPKQPRFISSIPSTNLVLIKYTIESMVYCSHLPNMVSASWLFNNYSTRARWI